MKQPAFTALILTAVALQMSACSLLGNQEEEWKSRMSRAFLAFEHKNYAEAERLYKECEERARSFAADDTRRAQTDRELAEVYIAQNKNSEAEPLLQRASNFYRERWNASDVGVANRDIGLDLATTSLKLGRIELTRGDYGSAAAHFDQALQVEETDLGSDQLKQEILADKAKLLELTGKSGQAARLRKQLTDLEPATLLSMPSMSTKSCPEVLRAAESSLHGLDHENAEQLFKLAITKAESAGADTKPLLLARAHLGLAQVYAAEKKYEESLDYARQARADLEDAGKTKVDTRFYCNVLLQVGNSLMLLKRYDEAIVVFKKDLDIMIDWAAQTKHLDNEKEILAPLVDCLVKTSNYSEAESYATMQLEVEDKTVVKPKSKFKITPAIHTLASIKAHLNKPDEARELMQRAIALDKNAPDPRRIIDTYKAYAQILRDLHEEKEADQASATAAKLQKQLEVDYLDSDTGIEEKLQNDD